MTLPADSPLPPHLAAAVRSHDLAVVVGQVLDRVPHVPGIPRNVELALPVIVPEPVSLPQVQTIGPWSEPVVVKERAERMGVTGQRVVRVAAVKTATVRAIAWDIDRAAAVRFTREPPRGCIWGLYLDATPVASCAVLCLRPVYPSLSPSPVPPRPPTKAA